MARLSTHVLDTARGKPAAGIEISLFFLAHGNERRLLKRDVTNADGRTDEPLLAGNNLVVGIYELVFNAGEYHRARGQATDAPPFLGEVIVRFGVCDSSGDYHIPLLLSPHAYSTYRGS